MRLPKALLQMSGLGKAVTLQAVKGKIIIKNSQDPRAGWREQIKAQVAMYGDPTDEFKDMKDLAENSLDNLPWDGPTYEQWQKKHGKS